MNWWVILLILIAIVFLFRMKHISHRFQFLIILIVILFLYISFSNVIQKNEIELNSISGMIVAGEAYFEWMQGAFQNTRTIVGNIIRTDWTSPS
jgi:hypothetical protein